MVNYSVLPIFLIFQTKCRYCKAFAVFENNMLHLKKILTLANHLLTVQINNYVCKSFVNYLIKRLYMGKKILKYINF